jgi:hypothetical protein
VTGDYQGAGHAEMEALRIERDLGNRLGQANAICNLGLVRRASGDYRGAAEAQAEALGIYQDLGDRRRQAIALSCLFQIEDYARAILSMRPNTAADAIEELVAARLQRQEVLGQEEPPLIWSLIDEAALYREVGTPEVMHGQLQHLVDLSRGPNVTIQVVPYSAGPHSGLLGAFVIAELDDSPPIAYLETAAEGETVEDPSVHGWLALMFDNLRSKALPDAASRDMIVKVAEERWKA